MWRLTAIGCLVLFVGCNRSPSVQERLAEKQLQLIEESEKEAKRADAESKQHMEVLRKQFQNDYEDFHRKHDAMKIPKPLEVGE